MTPLRLRNHAIWLDRNDGKTLRELEDKYRVSKTRIAQIYSKVQRTQEKILRHEYRELAPILDALKEMSE